MRHIGTLLTVLSLAVVGAACAADSSAPSTPAAEPEDANGTAADNAGEGLDETSLVPAENTPAGDTDDAVCWSATPTPRDGDLFEDTTEADELVEPLVGMYGHAAAAGDVNGDGWTDLFVAGFADRPDADYQVRGASGPSPDRLLIGSQDGFSVDPTFEGERARTSGAVFADLDNDGDLDLVVARNPRDGSDVRRRSTVIYEQTSDGWNTASSIGDDVAGRSVAAIDVDRDGLLDLAIAGDRFGVGPSRLYRNSGSFEFVDTTESWGMPDDFATLAIATVDIDSDGQLDIVASGDRRVLLGTGNGFEVVEVPIFEWERFGEEDDPAGIAVADFDRDGRPDLVVGQHFNSTIDDGRAVPVRVFLNRTVDDDVDFVDATESSGIPALTTKSPHVAAVDVDNDGHPDIVTSAASDDGHPVVLRNVGADTLQFETVGDEGDGSYWVTGVADDFDHDGRVDVFLVAWEPAAESKLFSGLAAGGHWLEVGLDAAGTDASLAVVDVGTGDDVTLRGWAQSTTGYAAGAPMSVRLGLGDDGNDGHEVTVRIPGQDPIVLEGVLDAHVAIGGC